LQNLSDAQLVASGPQHSSPLVSVVIPMFNAARTIERTLASVREQTHRNLEILIVDDGSTDNSLAIAKRLAADDQRVRIICQSNRGVASARNAGIAASSGAFVAPVDADDLWHPEKTALQLAAMAGPDGVDDPSIGLVYCWYSIIDGDDIVRIDDCRSTAEGDALEAMASRNIVGHGSGALMRREAVIRAGGYDTSLREQNGEGCEDYKLYFQIAEHYRFALVRQCLVGYRETRENMSSDPRKALRSRALCVAQLVARHPDLEARFHQGKLRIMRFMLGRALRTGNVGDAAFLLSGMLRTDPFLALASLGELAKGLFRRTLRTGTMRRPFLSELPHD
jgi:glycosyltransferase involved in cell wall biosynthesis